MQRWLQRAPIVALVLSVAVECSSAQGLSVERYNGRNPDRVESAAVRITFDFYPDGLIRSYSETYYDQQTKALTKGKSFTVARRTADNRAEVVTQTVSQTGQNASTNVSMRRNENVLVTFSQGSKDTSIEFRAKKQPAAATVFEYEHEGRVLLSLWFSPDENRISGVVFARDKAFEEKYIYKGGPNGLPHIDCQTPDNIRYEIRSDSGGKTVIDVAVIHGPLDESFWISGRPTHSDPTIAVMNYELLWDDPALANALYPYLGGSPR